VGDLSANFSRREFACKDGCGRDFPTAELVALLQRARDDIGAPLRIVSGLRCRFHNGTVGGSRQSQHIQGRAADVDPGYATIRQWRSYGAVGIGVRRAQVTHVDVRPGRAPFTFTS